MNACMRRWCLSAAAAAMAGVVSIGVAAQKPDPASGVWRLDVAKSKFSPGPATKSGRVTVDATDKTRKISAESVTADGTVLKWGYTATFDGKDVPVTGKHPNADMVSVKRLSPTSVETTLKQAGKVTLVNTASVSADGKTLTVTTTGTNVQGQKVNNVQVFEKQKG